MRQPLPRSALLLVLILVSLGLSDAAPPSRRNLTFAERVAAQEAIERVYHAHQIGATVPFEQAVPMEMIEAKVRAYLKRSVALERYWGTRITGTLLFAEAERMARSSLMPERLREVHAALDDDPLLILECLVRPILVDRLIRASHAADERVASQPFDDWWSSVASDLDADVVETVDDIPAALPRPRRSAGASAPRGDPAGLYAGCVPADTWIASDFSNPVPPRTGHTAVWTGSVMIVWGGLSGSIPLGTGFKYDPATDISTPIATAGAPSARSGHTSVFISGRMIVWGGRSGNTALGTGAIYRALTDTWLGTTSPVDAPSPRWGHTAVASSISEIIVWGGSSGGTVLDTGARFNMTANTWFPMPQSGSPAARAGHTAIWTGFEMIVWGGLGPGGRLADGARYSPGGSWIALPSAGAPTARDEHAATWTDDLMLVWGGRTNQGVTNTGAAWSLSTNAWSTLSAVDAPVARSLHTAVWDGVSMLIWGGHDPGVSAFNSGGSYDPQTDSWTPLATAGAPAARAQHTALWTGELMVAWGGADAFGGQYGGGGRYDPVAGVWLPSPQPPPSARTDPATVWTGNEMIVWSGQGYRSGRYNPATDTWSAVSTAGGSTNSYAGGAVWTGTEMILVDARYNPVTDTWAPVSPINPIMVLNAKAVWTGNAVLFWDGSRGARYNPSTDTWQPISTDGAPVSSQPSLVWTGSRMIAWGGFVFPFALHGAGGLYDPITDTWLPTSLQNAPASRYGHMALWTGTKMFVQGGAQVGTEGPQSVGPGGLYDPVTHTWEMLSQSAPMDATAVWTGSRVLIWGGRFPSFVPPEPEYEGAPWTFIYNNLGKSYDPAGNTWSSMTTSGAPEPRAGHAAVWTGSSLLVWGGMNCDFSARACWDLMTGGIYGFDPSTDSDGDGFGDNCDCDDSLDTVHPGAP